jgi:hypothetical protein
MSGVDFQQLQQMAQQAQMPPMQRQQQPPMMPQMQQMQQPMQMPMQPMQQQMQQMQPQFDLSQAIAAMQRQPMQSVQNPFFGGAIPMNFGLPQASQIPADFVIRQFTPGVFTRVPVNNFRNNPNNFVDYNNYGDGGDGGFGDDDGFGSDTSMAGDSTDGGIGDANL